MNKIFVTYNRITGEVKKTKIAKQNPDYVQSGLNMTTPYNTTKDEREIIINAIGSQCNGAFHHGWFLNDNNIISFKAYC